MTNGRGSTGEEIRAENYSNEQVGLKSRLSLFGAVIVIADYILGSAIFILPKGVHETAGSVGLSLIIWVLCGLFSAVGAYCYAELGTFIVKSGGDYAYVFVAFGPLIAYIRMWTECIIVRPCMLTAIALTFATYILRPFFKCGLPNHASQLLAACCLLSLTVVNILGGRWNSLAQKLFKLAKISALVLIVSTGLILLCSGGDHLSSFENSFAGTSNNPAQIALAFYFGLWTFNGWSYLNFIIEQLDNPAKNLPIAIGASCFICTIVYLLTNIAFYVGVTTDELLDSPAVAVTFADHYYGSFAWVVPIFVALSCFGAISDVFMTFSGLFYVAGRENHMPKILSMVNPYTETPIPLVLFTVLLSLFYLLLSESVYTLIIYVQIVNWIAVAVTTIGLIFLRYKMPPRNFPRTLQVHLAWPLMFLIGCIFLIVFPVIATPADAFVGNGMMATSLPVYAIFIWLENKPGFLKNLMDSLTFKVQKLLIVVPEEKKFG